MKPIAVYDGNSRKRLCYLQNAHNISYTKQKTALWTGSFSLPYSDPKTKYCESMNLVELWDVDSAGDDKYIGLFRIMPQESSLSANDSLVTYTLEHVLATLLDDTMLGWTEIGNLGVYTNTVINYILGQQRTKRWILGECDYRHQYLYGWQDENLLSALYSVPNSFMDDDLRWEFDTRRYPWTISLKRASSRAVTDIRYGKNIKGITKTKDPTNLTTRLYCYGYGESDNKLNIKAVNGGLPYLDSPNIAKYGVITRVWTDERFTHETSLLQSGRAMLKELEEPVVSYDIDIASVRKVSDLEAGDMVRVIDDGEDIYTRVVEITKDNVSSEPLVGTVVLANKTTDIAQSVADMADRQRIATTYSQGAETLFADSLYDNADASNPAELTFTVPTNAVHVNEIILNAKLTNFRAYSKATKGGGATATTTNSGGGVSTTSGSGGNSQQTSSSGGNSQQSSSNGGDTSTTASATVIGLENLRNSSTNDSTTNHNHGIARGVDLITDVTANKDANGNVISINLSTVTWAPSGAHTHGSHEHTVKVKSHSHTVNIPSHTHSVSIPSHTHSVSIPSHSHNFSIPNHTHDIEYGIYKGSRASSMVVRIDGVVVGTFDYSANNINLIEYMSKNANGEVLRGQHTISITPNTLTRVECSIQIRLFTNAHGAGQY